MLKVFFSLLLTVYISFADDMYKVIGNPYTKQYKNGEYIYARNIWDMQLYKGKIYLGAGNSSNQGPAKNAGRVYVVSLNPKNDKFKYEYKVAEEQIDIFKVYNDILFIPGHDATQKWTFGNIYQKTNDKWYKYRTLPDALHVYDLILKDNKIFTAIGLYGKGSVFISNKKTKKWTKIAHGKGRVYGFLEVGTELFATKTFKLKQANKLSVTQWVKDRNTFSARFDLNIYKMFPSTNFKNKYIKIIRPLKINNTTLYIGVYKHNDHQNEPFGVYNITYKGKYLKVSRIKLKDAYVPRDIIKRKDKIYILCSQDNNTTTTNVVLEFKNNNFHTYEEIISFPYPSFARSFEKLNKCFYFGIGTSIKNSKNWKQSELKEQTGDILKVCKRRF